MAQCLLCSESMAARRAAFLSTSTCAVFLTIRPPSPRRASPARPMQAQSFRAHQGERMRLIHLIVLAAVMLNAIEDPKTERAAQGRPNVRHSPLGHCRRSHFCRRRPDLRGVQAMGQAESQTRPISTGIDDREPPPCGLPVLQADGRSRTSPDLRAFARCESRRPARLGAAIRLFYSSPDSEKRRTALAASSSRRQAARRPDRANEGARPVRPCAADAR